MISGKAFSEKCKWVIDPRYQDRKQFDPIQAKRGDWVFVNGDYINTLFNRLLLTSKRFIFVIHNTDQPFTYQKLQKLKPYSIHIYAINTTTIDPILTTIPLGFVDKQLNFLSTFKPSFEERPYEIYMNFTMVTNMDKRNECYLIFKDSDKVTKKQNCSIEEYYNDLCKSKYVLCPEGTGIDTHRVYESILCGAIPVVLRNSLSHMYEKLPVCILDKWTDEFYEHNIRNFLLKPENFL